MAETRDGFPLHIPGLSQGLHLRVHACEDIHISRQIRKRGSWEDYETQLVCRYLHPGDCFLDAGANIGYFTVIAAARVGPGGRVFAFEPEPRNFALLQQNVALNGMQARVHCCEAALTDTTGTIELHLHPDNLGDHRVFAGAGARETVRVRGLGGAQYLGDRVAALKLVKVDTQGAELQVVRGLMPLLRRSGNELRMIVELTPYALRGAGGSGRVLIGALAALGLPLAIIDHVEHRLVPSSAAELADWCDEVDACSGDEGFMNIFVGEV